VGRRREPPESAKSVPPKQRGELVKGFKGVPGSDGSDPNGKDVGAGC